MSEDQAAPEKFPCENCGGALSYAPGEEFARCEYCGTENQIEESAGPWAILKKERDDLAELDLAEALSGAASAAQTEVSEIVHCDSCGADIDFDETQEAGSCPFCASPIVTGAISSRHIRPKGVLPFALKERDAKKAMNDWLGRLWFAPSDLKKYARAGRPMDGVYVPYWTFDAQTQSRYQGERGDVYYVTRMVPVEVNGKTVMKPKQVPKIRWTRVSGQVARFFDDVLILASKSLPKKYADRLGPWDLSALRPYQAAYLAGFRAEKYTVALDEGHGEARGRMEEVILRDIRFDIGGDRQRIHAKETSYRDETFKHILLPIWLAAYKYRGETYRFVVNGRTGSVQGERPYSAWKIAGAVVAGVIIAGAAGFALHASGALR